MMEVELSNSEMAELGFVVTALVATPVVIALHPNTSATYAVSTIILATATVITGRRAFFIYD